MVRPCIGAGRDSSACCLVGRSHSPCRSLKATFLALSRSRLENVRHSCPNTAGYRGLFNAVLWACGSFVNAKKFCPLRGYAA
jgi:hypothetical protein